jgi:hypothetical protein
MSTGLDIFTILRRVVGYYITEYAFFIARIGRYFNTKEGYLISEGKVFFDFYIT